MKNVSIKILDTQYPIRFNYASYRLLGNYWNQPTLGGVFEILTTLNFTEGDVNFDQMDKIGQLVMSGILTATPDAEIDLGDVVTAVLTQPEQMAVIMQLFGESIPKQAEPTKKKEKKK